MDSLHDWKRDLVSGINQVNKLIAIVLCALLAFPSAVLANAPVPPEVPKYDLGNFTVLQKDQQAPFSGFLFDQESVAKILAEIEFSTLELELKHDFELRKSEALWQLKLDNAVAANESLQEQSKSLNKIKDDEISRLREISLKQPSDYYHWWFAGGVVGGILLSLGVFYAAAEGFSNAK